MLPMSQQHHSTLRPSRDVLPISPAARCRSGPCWLLGTLLLLAVFILGPIPPFSWHWRVWGMSNAWLSAPVWSFLLVSFTRCSIPSFSCKLEVKAIGLAFDSREVFSARTQHRWFRVLDFASPDVRLAQHRWCWVWIPVKVLTDVSDGSGECFFFPR